MKKYYSHWTKVPRSEWPWKNFTPEEIACRGTGELIVDTDAMNRLQALRDLVGVMILNSAYRSPSHNSAIGGAPGSSHLLGEAYDVSMVNHDPLKFFEAAKSVGFKGFGHYPRNNFMHIDCGPARSWGASISEWRSSDSRFAAETPLAPETLSQDKTIAGSGVVGAGTAGSAGVEALRAGLVDAQGWVQQAMPYLDTLKWVFIALALAGAAVVLWTKVQEWKGSRR
jgi:zinc D-Ala-D-Ala carboxypeptidase